MKPKLINGARGLLKSHKRRNLVLMVPKPSKVRLIYALPEIVIGKGEVYLDEGEMIAVVE